MRDLTSEERKKEREKYTEEEGSKAEKVSSELNAFQQLRCIRKIVLTAIIP